MTEPTRWDRTVADWLKPVRLQPLPEENREGHDLADRHLELAFEASARYAQKYQGDPAEHVSHAWMGLQDAARKFDRRHRAGATFKTYAAFRIRGAILDGLRAEQGRNGQGEFNRSLESLDAEIPGTNRPAHVRDLVPGPAVRPAVDLEFWRIACKGLNKSERILLLLYFIEGLPLWQIGQRHIGVCESRCSQMLSDLGPFIAITLWRHHLVE
jgi:RNA polymerase sigma factor (sigma-70 family)